MLRHGAYRTQRRDGRARARARAARRRARRARRRRRPPASRWRASQASARRTCSPRCAPAPRIVASSCSSGSATEFERDLPFSVWVDALDAYVASQELELDELWSAELVDELAEIIPSVRTRGDGAAHGPSPTSATARIGPFAGCSSCSPRERPLVVVLDDLHWSDDASIELLAALLRREPDAPVLLALALPSRAGAGRPRAAALAVPSARRIALEPLDEAQATQLLGDLEPRAAAAIYRHGGGNPFYLEQLRRAREDGRLAAAIDSAADRRSSSPRVPVPAAVAASLAEELASLPAEELALLRAAAVAGEPFEPDLAAAIAELPRGRRGSRRSTRCWRSTSCARRRCRAASSSATRSCGGRSTKRTPAGWRLGGPRAGGRSARRSRRGRGRARPPLEQYATQGDEEAISVLLEAGDGRRGARSGRGRSLVRSGPAAAAGGGRAPGRRACRARLLAPLARRARSLRRDAACRDRAAPRRTPSRDGSS